VSLALLLLAEIDAFLAQPIAEGLFYDPQLPGHVRDAAVLFNDEDGRVPTELLRKTTSTPSWLVWFCIHNCHDYFLYELSGKWGEVH
jgi:hypothetical protein